MYNMTLREFGQLMQEYNEIEEIKKSSLRELQFEPNREKSRELMKQYTARREEFVNKFQ